MTKAIGVGEAVDPRAPHMTRGRLFSLVSALEADMRRILREHVIGVIGEAEALGADFASAALRKDSDTAATTADVVEYLDFQPEVLALARSKTLLPSSLKNDVEYLSTMIASLAPLRNRVMHGRPLQPNDFSLAVSVAARLNHRDWSATTEVLRRVRSDDTWDPSYGTLDRSSDRVLNNLPVADYDDTGLIGRDQELRGILQILKKRRTACVTVTGEGGIGKTALALEAAYALLDDADAPFDLIVWTTLKTERLTVDGVRAIDGAVRDLGGLREDAAALLGDDIAGTAMGLANALQGIDTLLVIDNLETVRGDEVVELLDALPPSVSVLATSRVGLGQLERRVQVGPLTVDGASLLFRKHAAQNGLPKLASSSAQVVNEVVHRLRYSPLAIRWYLLSLAAGAEPLSTLRNQTELIEFCVRNVVEGLGEDATGLLAVVAAVPDSLSFDEAAVFCDIPIDALRRAAQELARAALINYEPRENAPEVTQMRLSESARQYLPRDWSVAMAGKVEAARQEYRRSDERRRQDESSRSLAPHNVRVRTEEERPSAYLLRQALTESRHREFEKAHELVSRALELSPEYWEAHRVLALLKKWEGDTQGASAAFRDALHFARLGSQRAIVNHDYAQFLAKSMSDTVGAVAVEREAHAVLGLPDTQLALGNYLVWLQEFDEAISLLRELATIQLGPERSVDGRFRAICFTALVDALRRHAEVAWERSEQGTALSRSFEAWEFGVEMTNADMLDTKLAERTLRAGIDAITFAMKARSQDVDEFARIVSAVGAMSRYSEMYRVSSYWERFSHTLERFLADGERSTPVSVDWVFEVEDQGSNRERPIRAVGRIKAWGTGYGFITVPDHPDVFVHSSEIKHLATPDATLIGRTIAFDIVEDAGRFRAESCSFVS